jgi:hypothetical protein
MADPQVIIVKWLFRGNCFLTKNRSSAWTKLRELDSPLIHRKPRGEARVPTNISLSIANRRDRNKKNAADLTAVLFLIPSIACLGSITLCFECHAFERAVIQMADE